VQKIHTSSKIEVQFLDPLYLSNNHRHSRQWSTQRSISDRRRWWYSGGGG